MLISDITAAAQAYGQAVLTQGLPRKPAVSRLAEQDAELSVFVLGQLRLLAAVPGAPAGDPDLREFLSKHLAPPEPMPSHVSGWALGPRRSLVQLWRRRHAEPRCAASPSPPLTAAIGSKLSSAAPRFAGHTSQTGWRPR